MTPLLRLMLSALLIAAPCCAASLDFAVSVSLPGGIPIFAVDRQGNILIAERLQGTCPPAALTPLNTCGPILVAKLDASGQKLLFVTHLGQGYGDLAGIA